MSKAEQIAKREIAREKARILRKRIEDPRVLALEEEAQAYKKRKEEEEAQRRLQEEVERRERNASPLTFKELRSEEYNLKEKKDEEGVVDWLQKGIGDWKKKRKVQEGPKRFVNAASIWVFARKLMAREWARALGKKRPDPREVALMEEARIWERRKEENKLRLHRERRMLEAFCQLLLEDKKFPQTKEEETYEFGGVNFLIKKRRYGYKVYIEALEKSPYIQRKGWSDLLGRYELKVNNEFNCVSYRRKEKKK